MRSSRSSQRARTQARSGRARARSLAAARRHATSRSRRRSARLRALCELCDAPAGPRPADGRRSPLRSRREARPARARADASRGRRLRSSSAAADLPPSIDPAALMEAWEDAAETALASARRSSRSSCAPPSRASGRARRSAAKLSASSAARGRRPPPPAAGDDERCSASCSQRRPMRARRGPRAESDALRADRGAALDAAESDASLRALFRRRARAGAGLRQLFRVWGCTLLSLGNCFPAQRDSDRPAGDRRSGPVPPGVRGQRAAALRRPR